MKIEVAGLIHYAICWAHILHNLLTAGINYCIIRMLRKRSACVTFSKKVCENGGIGRRARFRSVWEQSLVSSSLISRIARFL